MGSPRVSKNFVADESRVNCGAPKGARGCVYVRLRRVGAPTTTARHWNDGISGHFVRSA